MMDYDRCIGCRYCEVACPYGGALLQLEKVRRFKPGRTGLGSAGSARRPRGVVEKCSFCYQRIDRGLALGLPPGVDEDATPACVWSAQLGPCQFGDLKQSQFECQQALAQPRLLSVARRIGYFAACLLFTCRRGAAIMKTKIRLPRSDSPKLHPG